jgi:hypothetical protein
LKTQRDTPAPLKIKKNCSLCVEITVETEQNRFPSVFGNLILCEQDKLCCFMLFRVRFNWKNVKDYEDYWNSALCAKYSSRRLIKFQTQKPRNEHTSFTGKSSSTSQVIICYVHSSVAVIAFRICKRYYNLPHMFLRVCAYIKFYIHKRICRHDT